MYTPEQIRALEDGVYNIMQRLSGYKDRRDLSSATLMCALTLRHMIEGSNPNYVGPHYVVLPVQERRVIDNQLVNVIYDDGKGLLLYVRPESSEISVYEEKTHDQ